MNPSSFQDRVCPDCGSKITGRKDRKFCSDMCRINYHNMLYSRNHKVLRSINARLKQNRSILETLFNNGIQKTSGTFLESEGFSPLFHTHTREQKKGSIVRFCYEYGIYPFHNEFIIVKESGE